MKPHQRITKPFMEQQLEILDDRTRKMEAELKILNTNIAGIRVALERALGEKVRV